MEINQRLQKLRAAIQQAGIDAYIIPSNDPHQSEYVAEHWKSREWITGFTGSAGIAVITEAKAGLWTDSRYYLQAEQELKGTAFEMQPLYQNGKTQYPLWLLEKLPEDSVVGIDGLLWTENQVRQIRRQLATKNIQLKTDVDLINIAWADRPALPAHQIFEHHLPYAGESRIARLTRIRALLQAKGAEHYLVNKLDDIAWVLNLRGRDVSFNPVFIAYLWISPQDCTLFIDLDKVPVALQKTLTEDQIKLKPYDQIESFLIALPSEHPMVYVEPSLSVALRKRLNPECSVYGPALIQAQKAIKNSTEIDHMRTVMIKDGVALVRFYRWLEELIPSGYLTEYDCAQQLAHFRAQQDLYFGESFSAIVGYRANGAIVHYRPDAKFSSTLEAKGLLLIDSGGQYLDGTTDITRTITLGDPTKEEIGAFTQVLKGHIALSSIHFPEGTRGGQLDALARMYLWKAGRNFGHGTGHGVGFFLNVHEGPQSISASARGNQALQIGMITSNEPGFYKEGTFGIRTENLVLCVESEHSSAEQIFLKFETLTLFPIDLNLIDFSLLEPEEIHWLNNYHREVYQRLSPVLHQEERKWLAEKCQAIEY